MARFSCILICTVLILLPVTALAAPLEEGAPMTLTAPSAILLEADTGAVIRASMHRALADLGLPDATDAAWLELIAEFI